MLINKYTTEKLVKACAILIHTTKEMQQDLQFKPPIFWGFKLLNELSVLWKIM